jgi:hypothetical protein
MGAAVEVPIRFDAVAYDLHAAVLAHWGEGVYGALEAVEGARPFSGHTYLKSLVVLISTDLALGHAYHPFPASIWPTLSCTS